MKILFAALVASLCSTAESVVPVNYQPEELKSVDGLLDVTLDVAMLESLNGTRIAPAYNGAPVGPTLRVKPGDTLRVKLNNNLEPGTDVDRELYEYVLDPLNDLDEKADVNVTIIYNRLDEIGNIYNPTYGYWGLQRNNIHFHGAQFPLSIENIRYSLDGGESKEYVFEIPQDMSPGLFWYHNHNHGTTAYSYLSSLFGFFVVEGTDNDITKSPGVQGATEVFMALSEGLVNPDKSVPPFFPLIMQFNWDSVVNGELGSMTEYEFMQGTTVLFRVVSATVEPDINLSIPGVTFVVIAYDGLPLPEPKEVEVVSVSGGSRVEFLAQFDTPGKFVMSRAAWAHAPALNEEGCKLAFNVPVYPCISFDVEREVATITVLADETSSAKERSGALVNSVDLPGYSNNLLKLANTGATGNKTVIFELEDFDFPIFQIPYDGPFVPPGLGYGINGRLSTPWRMEGNVTAGTCETWEVISTQAGLAHPFHVHPAKFLVTHIDGEEVDDPFWRDTMPIGANLTVHICFDMVEPGETIIVHCHAASHLDVGMAAYYKVLENPAVSENPMDTSAAPDLTVFLALTALKTLSLVLLW